MAENTTEIQFHRAHLFIGEGQIDEALAVLEQIQPASQQEKQEIAYLRAWCYAELNRWEEAAQFLLAAGAAEEALHDIQAQRQTERRRRAYYQLIMGNVATNMGHYEEGMRHYRQCIKFLDERRMNIPSLRIRALRAMGTLATIIGLYDLALTHYQDALHLCSENAEHPNLSDIYYGLCDMYRHKGNFPLALEYGKKALRLYSDRQQPDLVGRMRNLLGRVCFQMRDFAAAGTYYTEALALAMLEDKPVMILNNLTALADLRREEGDLEEAWRYCNMALAYAPKLPSGTGHFVGMMYLVCGKVQEARSQAATGQQAHELLEKAIEFYQQSVQTLSATDARVALAETYQRLAQALEAAGRQAQAMEYWKSAYATSSISEDSPFL